jgi:hypothetical protein
MKSTYINFNNILTISYDSEQKKICIRLMNDEITIVNNADIDLFEKVKKLLPNNMFLTIDK